MYREFFGLEQRPFGLTPNTSLYYGLPPHEEALEVLRAALLDGEGFISISGEVGTGKTMVLRMFTATLPEDYELVYIPNPMLSPGELYLSVARELRIDPDGAAGPHLIDRINRRLLEISGSGGRAVMVIDEAQALPDETLEALRLLGNLETEQDKLLQIVLFAQPELEQRLRRDSLRQLRQRISFSYALRPLTPDETRSYVNYRMKAAGYRGAPVFGARAAKVIHRRARGIPRLINIIANKCLILCYGYGIRAVPARVAEEAAADGAAGDAPRSAFPRWLKLLAVLAAAAVATAGLLYIPGAQ